MSDELRKTARAIAHKHLRSGDPLGWFEDLYSQAEENVSIIPWADLKPNANFIDWLDHHSCPPPCEAIKIGSGLGDDAEELSRRGFTTTAFDISKSAIAWSKKRFPRSSVSYVTADLFSLPVEWKSRFGFVLESYTLQVLPPDLRATAIQCVASLVAPEGMLLVIARGREPTAPKGEMPWPLTREELSLFKDHGLKELIFEDYLDSEKPPVRRFRVTYRKEA